MQTGATTLGGQERASDVADSAQDADAVDRAAAERVRIVGILAEWMLLVG